MAGMKFRRSCDRCNATFFSEDRKARFCPKHQPKQQPTPTLIKSRPPQSPQHSSAAPAPVSSVSPALSPAPHHHPASSHQSRPPFQRSGKFVAGDRPRPGGGGGPRNRPSFRDNRKKTPKQPRLPQQSVLTPELRDQIIKAFEIIKKVPGSELPINQTLTELNLRNIHTQISQQLWVKRSLVAQVIREVRNLVPAVTSVDLTPEQYERATQTYAHYVQNGLRPEGGRRKSIARELGVPLQSVVLAVRKWAQERYLESQTPQPTRRQLFEIEKCYWRHMNEGKTPYELFPEAIAKELGFVTGYQVLRWVDVLHDNTKVLNVSQEPTPEQKEHVITAYHEYLKSEKPPEHALHPTLAKQVGISAKQVHKVLYDYRMAQRDRYLQLVMV